MGIYRQKRLLLMFCVLGAQLPAAGLSLKDSLRYGGGAAALIAAGVAVYQSKRIAGLKKHMRAKRQTATGVGAGSLSNQSRSKELNKAQRWRALAFGGIGAGLLAVLSTCWRSELKKGEDAFMSGKDSGSPVSSSANAPRSYLVTNPQSLRQCQNFVVGRCLPGPEPEFIFDSRLFEVTDVPADGHCGFSVIRHFLSSESYSVETLRRRFVDEARQRLIAELAEFDFGKCSEMEARDLISSAGSRVSGVDGRPKKSFVLTFFDWRNDEDPRKAPAVEDDESLPFLTRLEAVFHRFSRRVGCGYYVRADQKPILAADGIDAQPAEWHSLFGQCLLEDTWLEAYRELPLAAEILQRPILYFFPYEQGAGFKLDARFFPQEYDRRQFDLAKVAFVYNSGNHFQILTPTKALQRIIDQLSDSESSGISGRGSCLGI